MKYYKITNEEELHKGLQYKTGLVEDIVPFNPSGICRSGGIYFAREDILAFLEYGPWIREVIIPEDAQVYEEPVDLKTWKADKVILCERRRVTPEVIEGLIEEGADVHAYDDEALCWAARNDHLEIVKLLLKHGANVHVDNDYALRYAAEHGSLEIVKTLLDSSADIHAVDDWALRWAAGNGHLEIVKLLLEKGADIHAVDDWALRWATARGHTEVVKVLEEAMKGKTNEIL